MDAIEAEGGVAKAVLARLTANLTGETGEDQSVQVGQDEDLLAAVAKAAPGATLYLAAGEYRLSDPLVLLDGLTIAGAGQEETVVVSSSAEVSVVVISPDLVGLRGLTVRRDTEVPGSVVVAGGSVTLAIEEVVLRGGRAAKDVGGGAGLDLAGASGGTAPAVTTVELTNVDLVDNGWAGLAVGTGHRVSMSGGRIADNGECGACFLAGAQGSLEDVVVVDNGVGVAAVGASTPVLSRLRISGGEVGVQVGDTASPSIDDTTILDTERAGLIFTDAAAGVLRQVTCRKVPVGIVLSSEALPSLIEVECTLVRQE